MAPPTTVVLCGTDRPVNTVCVGMAGSRVIRCSVNLYNVLRYVLTPDFIFLLRQIDRKKNIPLLIFANI